MLKNISKLGSIIDKKELQSIKGGLWNSLNECLENCQGICVEGIRGQRWVCFE
ncbi:MULTISPECIES: bacteriocin [unclassified Tenacibaculum]|uniref:bacteriocin n=1 Tax=unclassified Tenacibaculum TaxID=2635139 RepID=UPI00351D5A19